MSEVRGLLEYRIQEFLADTGLSKTTLGRLALGNHKAIWSLLAGGNMNLSTAARLEKWMADYRQAHAAQQTRRAA